MALDKKNRLETKFQEHCNSVLESKRKEDAKRLAIEKETGLNIKKEQEKQIMWDFKCVITSYNMNKAKQMKSNKYNHIFLSTSQFLMYQDYYISIIKKLKFIDLSSMNLNRYPLNALNHATNLGRLNLSNNPGLGLMHNPKSFESFQKVSVSSLLEETNKLAISPKSSVKAMFCKNIKILSLNGNRLARLPFFIENCQNLEILHLNDNRIEALQDEIGKLHNLVYLDFYNNRLSNISKEIGSLPRLEYLDLSGNRIVELPLEIGNLRSLRHLNLNSNHLTDLPSTIGKLQNLVDMRLSFNALSCLPEEVKNLRKLEILHMDHNQIAQISDGIADLKSLKVLDFSNNRILHFPKCALKLNEIEEINGKNNSLTSIPDGFDALQKLRKLDLSSNRIPSLPKDINSLSLKLASLDLRSNPIVDADREGSIGRYGLTRIFGGSVILDPVEFLAESEEISKDKVYEDLKLHKICWVFEEIRKIKNEEIPRISESAEELAYLLEKCIRKCNARAGFSDEDLGLIKNLINHICSSEEKYSKHRISNGHSGLVKDMLGSVLRVISDGCDHDKTLITLSIILEALNYCEDRLVAEIRSLYYYLNGSTDPYQNLEAYVYKMMAAEKEKILFYSVSHQEATQSTHLYNYWMYELREEIGFSFDFDTALGTQGQDKFNGWHGNAIRAFYSLFNPEHIVYELAEKINSTPQILCLALKWLYVNGQEEDNFRKMYIKGVEDGADFALGITREFMLFFMRRIGLISKTS